MAGYTISMSQGNHAEEHSRRSYTPMSADASLTKDNVVIFDAGNDKEHFNGFFADAIEEYNDRQVKARHPERQKSFDYYDDLLNGVEGYGKGKTQEKPIYDDVIQIGNRDTNGVTKRTFDVDHWRALKAEGRFHEASSYVKKHLNNDPDREELTKTIMEECEYILSESANSREYRKAHGLPPGKYDNILIHRLIVHRDEPNGTDHIDMAYTIFTDEGDTKRKDGRQNGLSRRVSARKGLAKMGFKKSRDQFALEKFRESIKDEIQERMESRGYQRDIKGEHRRHLSPQMFEVEQRAKEAEAKVEAEEEKLANLQEESAGLSDRIAKVEDDEKQIRIKQKKQADKDNEQSKTDEDQQKREDELIDFRDNTLDLMFNILRMLDPERDYLEEVDSISELQHHVEIQYEKFVDEADKVLKDKEDLKEKMKIINEMMGALEDLPEPKGKMLVFEAVQENGRVSPKKRDGKVVPPRYVSDIVKEHNDRINELRRMKQDADGIIIEDDNATDYGHVK